MPRKTRKARRGRKPKSGATMGARLELRVPAENRRRWETRADELRIKDGVSEFVRRCVDAIVSGDASLIGALLPERKHGVIVRRKREKAEPLEQLALFSEAT